MASNRYSRRRGAALAAATAMVGLGLAACSSDDGGSSDADTTSADIDVDKEYAPGVPTMAELYQGTSHEPPSSAPKPESGKTIYYMSCDSSVAACLDPGLAMQEAAKEVGWKVNLIDGKFDAGGAFSSGVRSAIAANADAIVLYGISCDPLAQALKEAKAADIPVMSISALDCDEAGGDESLFTVKMQANKDVPDTSVEYSAEMAANSAYYIINATEGKAKLLMTHGTEAQLVVGAEAFREAFAKCADCEIVDDVEYDISDLAPNGPWIQAWRQALIKHGNDINAVYPEWDGHMIGSGGLQAIQEAGLKGKVNVFGGEGIDATFEAVRNGSLNAVTKVHSSGWLGYAAVDTLNRQFNDVPQVPQGVGVIVVDKENQLPAEGEQWAPEFDFKSAYKKIWEEGKG